MDLECMYPFQMSSYTIEQLKQAILSVCEKINLTYSTTGDGRITSAIKELEYLTLLEKGLKETHPTLVFEHQPVERWWWDFRVNTVPFNLKLTTGGTDNAFNKTAILYSLSGIEVPKRNMNFNQFYHTYIENPKKTERNPMTEYHYLVVHKTKGAVLVKSIFDIHTYKSNPCNILQINWDNEFRHTEHTTDFLEKTKDLLKTIQKSVKQDVESKLEFANATFVIERV